MEIIERMRPHTPPYIPEFNLMLTFAGHFFLFQYTVLCLQCSEGPGESLGPHSSKLCSCLWPEKEPL